MRLVTIVRGIAAVCLVAAVTAACSSGSTTGSTPGASSGKAATGDSSSADLASYYRGSYASPPASAPKVSGKKTVYIVSCGQLSVTCVNISAAAVEAAKTLGWTTRVCDGKLNPTAWGSCVRQAIAAKADAAITEGIDCETIKQPLQEAKSAGMPVINLVGFDCDDPAAGGGQSLFAANVQQTKEQPTIAAYWEAAGRAQAAWIIAKSKSKSKSKGQAKVLLLDQPSAIVTYVNKGLEAEMAANCPGCKIVDRIKSSVAQTDVPAKVSTALAQHPEANALAVPFDATFALGLQQALVSGGRGRDLLVIGKEGGAANIGYIRSGQGQDATVGADLGWYGWAAIDTVLRVLAGQKAVPEGCGSQLVDKDHNMPPVGSAYKAPVDFRSAYKKAWGVG